MKRVYCKICKYSEYDYYPNVPVLRDVYCKKNDITDYHTPYDELDTFNCEDYEVSVIRYGLSHLMEILMILLVLCVIRVIIDYMGVM